MHAVTQFFFNFDQAVAAVHTQLHIGFYPGHSLSDLIWFFVRAVVLREETVQFVP